VFFGFYDFGFWHLIAIHFLLESLFATTSSAKVFHELHEGHLPSHLAWTHTRMTDRRKEF